MRIVAGDVARFDETSLRAGGTLVRMRFFDALIRLAQGRCWMPETV